MIFHTSRTILKASFEKYFKDTYAIMLVQYYIFSQQQQSCDIKPMVWAVILNSSENV